MTTVPKVAKLFSEPRAFWDPVGQIERVLDADAGAVVAIPFRDDIAHDLMQQLGLPSPPVAVVERPTLAGVLDAVRNELVRRLVDMRRAPQVRAPRRKNAAPRRSIFLGHGRNALWRAAERYLEKELGLAVEAFESSSRAGRHVVEVLEGLLAQSAFAVMVVTAEDETADGDVRARQNVVHEIGLFQGRLGFNRVALLMQKGVEPFSNIAGLQYIEFEGDNIEGAFYELGRMLRREKIVEQ